MIYKLDLYIDTIKRIPLKQNLFLVKEKILKKILPINLSTLEKIESEFYSKELWSNFLKNSKKLIDQKNSQIFWNSGVSGNNFHHHYDLFVKNKLNEYKETDNINIIDSFWETTHEDIEFIYNLQRMYKFNEIMEILEFNDSQKIRVINSWIDKHPPQKDAAWMGFNCSIRLINWVKILTSLQNKSLIKEEEIKKIFLSIFQNLEFIIKNIEHHIPGNHVIFQYFSTWLTFSLIGDKKADIYAKLFSDEFENEFLKSGLHFELSTHYHLQVLQLGVYFCLINYDQKEIPKTIFLKVQSAYSVLDSFSFRRNNLPLLGDNCYNFFHNNLVEDAKNLNTLRDLLGIEEDKNREIIELKDQYLIAARKKIKIIFDVGNIGMKQNPGHGHSDILSFNFAYDGLPIFIDPGTKRYSNHHKDLELKKTYSHNTISVNSEDQSKLWGFFRWAFLPEKTTYEYKSVENSVILKARFEGFKNIGGANHSRKIMINDSEIIISDRVESNRLKTIEQNFILSELVTFEENSSNYYLNVGNYKFKFIIDIKESYNLDIIQQNIYTSYDNHLQSKKIRIVYNASSSEVETKIIIRLIDE